MTFEDHHLRFSRSVFGFSLLLSQCDSRVEFSERIIASLASARVDGFVEIDAYFRVFHPCIHLVKCPLRPYWLKRNRFLNDRIRAAEYRRGSGIKNEMDKISDIEKSTDLRVSRPAEKNFLLPLENSIVKSVSWNLS